MEIETRSNTCLYPILVFILYTCFMIVSVLILDQEFVRLIVVDFFFSQRRTCIWFAIKILIKMIKIVLLRCCASGYNKTTHVVCGC